MKLPMHARTFRLLLLIPMTSLASCELSESQPAQAIAAVLSEPTPAARKKVIHHQLAAICPTPLTDDELEWAAQFIEENRSKGTVWIAGRLLRMQRETKICRGM